MTEDTVLVFGRDFDLGFLVPDNVYIPKPLRPGETRFFGAAMPEPKQVRGIWTLGDIHESESDIMSVALQHSSLDDEPLHIWALTREEFLHADPETLTREIPLALRQQYDIDLVELSKAFARKQREVEKPWKRIIREAGKPVRLIGEQPVLVDELAPKIPDPQPYGSDMELFERILGFLKANVIFAEPETYTIVASWILLTWRIEDTNVAPYLYVTAPRGHGKTRLLETIHQLIRRPLLASYATRAGAIRALDGTNAALLLDEAEHYVNPHERQSSDLAAVLNAGYRRGARAIMVADVIETLPDGTHRSVKKPVALDTFGAKVIASRRDIFDTLEDRSVQIIMPKHGKNLGPIDEKHAEGLRGQLAQYRVDCLERKQPLRANLPETGDARLSEILEPLYAVTPEQYRDAYHTIMDQERSLRLRRIQESYEYAILEAFDAVVTVDTQDRALILTETVTDAYNSRHASKPTTNKTVGRTLARLGFKAADAQEPFGPDGRRIHKRGYRLDRKLLDRLKNEYGLAEPTSEPTEPREPTTLDSILHPSPIIDNPTLSSDGSHGSNGSDTKEASTT
jgi:hypothetical protein